MKTIGKVLFISIGVWFLYSSISQQYLVQNQEERKEIEENIVVEQKEEPVLEERNKNWVETTYKGYPVEAKLIIPEISLETYILAKDQEEEAMQIAPVKWYGVGVNQIGNCCIAGHNYEKENMFQHLKKLEKGDTFTLINEVGEISYEIYDVYKVYPKQTYPLLQNDDGKREVTLITCSDYSKKRIIIKAKEEKQ